jgi:hypothetical protein
MPELRQPQQPLARAVDGHLLGHDLRPVEGEKSLERLARLLRDVRHLVERRRARNVEPAPELADAHAPLLLGHARSRHGFR